MRREKMDYLEIANSLPLWFAAGFAVILVLLQAFLFVKKSLNAGSKMGLTDDQMKSAIRSSALSSIGPSLAILAGMISLLVAIGGPLSWMRLSFIGSVMFELMAAGFGTEALGIKLGSEGMNGLAFANAVWTMTLGAVGWLLFTGLFTSKMDKLRNTLAGGKEKLIPIISTSAMLGAFAYLNAGRILAFDKGTIALITGAMVMTILIKLANKAHILWIKEWALAISMFSGMFVAVVF